MSGPVVRTALSSAKDVKSVRGCVGAICRVQGTAEWSKDTSLRNTGHCNNGLILANESYKNGSTI